jgi:hypothetical protein
MANSKEIIWHGRFSKMSPAFSKIHLELIKKKCEDVRLLSDTGCQSAAGSVTCLRTGS